MRGTGGLGDVGAGCLAVLRGFGVPEAFNLGGEASLVVGERMEPLMDLSGVLWSCVVCSLSSLVVTCSTSLWRSAIPVKMGLSW